MIWLLQNLTKPLVSFITNLAPAVEHKIVSPHDRALYDVNLAKLSGIAEQMGPDAIVQFSGSLGWMASDSSDGFLHVRPKPSRKFLRLMSRCLSWETPMHAEDSLIDDLQDDVVAAVLTGEIGQLEDALKLSRQVIATLFETLASHGLANADGVEDFAHFVKVVSTFRSALEEAVRSQRGEVASKTAWAISSSIKICVKARNLKCTRRLASLFPLLREVVRKSGLSKEPRFSDLHWRPLKEILQIITWESREENDEFLPKVNGIVQDALVEMLGKSIEEGADDLDELLNAWRLTVGEDEPRRRRTGGDSVESRQQSNVHWLVLCAWALHLFRYGKISGRNLLDVLNRLGSRIGNPSQLVVTTESAKDQDDSDRLALANWIIWADGANEGRVVMGGVTSQIILAFVVLLLSRAQRAESGSLSVSPSIEQAAAIAQESIKMLEELRSPTNELRPMLVNAQVLSEPLDPSIESCVELLKDAMAEQARREKAILRDAPLDMAVVDNFVRSVRQGFRNESFFHQIPTVATIRPNVEQPSGLGSGPGYNQLVPKVFFVGSERATWSGMETEFVTGLARAEMQTMLEDIASKEEPRSVGVDQLLDAMASIAKEMKGGCFVVQGVASRLNIYRHPDFAYPQNEPRRLGQIGTLAGVPVYYGLDIRKFSAIYLPPKSITVGYRGSMEQPTEVVHVKVEEIDADRAREIVSDWRAKVPTKYASDAEYEADILRVQENCGVRLLIQPSIIGKGVVVFQTEQSIDEYDVEPEDEVNPE